MNKLVDITLVIFYEIAVKHGFVGTEEEWLASLKGKDGVTPDMSEYQTQIQHYEEVINKNRDWVLAGIFADDGISATSTKHREQFNKMIQACKDGKIDMIITKSISRFARNTVDCLNYIRELKALNIPIFFEKESINTMDAKGDA